MTPIARINYINIILILCSCALAFIFPYSLLIFSFAVLGPAHYLTQISWLHDRKYFAAEDYTLHSMILIVAAFMISPKSMQGALLLGALFLALALAFPLNPSQRRIAILIALLAAVILGQYSPVALFFTLLLPTVLHTFVFTAMFMLVGALKEDGNSGLIALGIFFLCTLSLFAAPVYWYGEDIIFHPGLGPFILVVSYMEGLLGMIDQPDSLVRMFGFLSFIYTYHYLNWFSKTRIVPWHRIPRRRAWGIVALYIGTLGLYAYDFMLGIFVILSLALLHVVLEFPLNWQTAKMIAGRAIVKQQSAIQ